MADKIRRKVDDKSQLSTKEINSTDDSSKEDCYIFEQNLEQFMFSFYVKIDRENTEEENLSVIKDQLQNLEEIDELKSIYFKRYFSRLQFNEVVIDFLTSFSSEWRSNPKKILRKLRGYNDAYKFSQLKTGNQ